MTRDKYDEGPRSDREELFAVFFIEHHRGVERFVRWRIGTEMAEVDDVCSEVFFVALMRFDVLSDLPPSAVRSWLLRVAEHKCSNTGRSRFRRDRAYRRVAVDPETEGRDPFDDVYLQQLGDDGQLAERAREVIACLPERHREVLQLELDGPISGRAMAAALGTTEVAGRLRLMRAKRALGAEYERRYGWIEPRLNEEGAS